MRGVYATLAALTIAAAGATLIFADDVAWIERFGPNLATEALGIVITLVVVQRVLDRQDRARKLRGSIGALRKSGDALSTVVRTWGELLKGSLERMPVERPHSVDGFFLPYVTESLTDCDPRLARAEDGIEQPWVQWAAHRFADAQAALHDVIMAYGATLEPTYVEAIDELVDDPFLALVRELGTTPGIDPQRWRVRINTAPGLRDVHFARLLHAVEMHNTLAREAARFRNPDTAPRRRTIGIGHALDHDLHVNTEIDPEWWSRPPEPGTLRAVAAPATASPPADASR